MGGSRCPPIELRAHHVRGRRCAPREPESEVAIRAHQGVAVSRCGHDIHHVGMVHAQASSTRWSEPDELPMPKCCVEPLRALTFAAESDVLGTTTRSDPHRRCRRLPSLRSSWRRSPSLAARTEPHAPGSVVLRVRGRIAAWRHGAAQCWTGSPAARWDVSRPGRCRELRRGPVGARGERQPTSRTGSPRPGVPCSCPDRRPASARAPHHQRGRHAPPGRCPPAARRCGTGRAIALRASRSPIEAPTW